MGKREESLFREYLKPYFVGSIVAGEVVALLWWWLPIIFCGVPLGDVRNPINHFTVAGLIVGQIITMAACGPVIYAVVYHVWIKNTFDPEKTAKASGRMMQGTLLSLTLFAIFLNGLTLFAETKRRTKTEKIPPAEIADLEWNLFESEVWAKTLFESVIDRGDWTGDLRPAEVKARLKKAFVVAEKYGLADLSDPDSGNKAVSALDSLGGCTVRLVPLIKELRNPSREQMQEMKLLLRKRNGYVLFLWILYHGGSEPPSKESAPRNRKFESSVSRTGLFIL